MEEQVAEVDLDLGILYQLHHWQNKYHDPSGVTAEVRPAALNHQPTQKRICLYQKLNELLYFKLHFVTSAKF